MRVGSTEAKTHLASLLQRVAEGERITITRHGVPVATLIPASSAQRPRRATIDDLRAFRSGRELGADLTLRELIEEGRH